MQLLAGKHYDPATLITATGTTNSALTAFDTTNLRLTFTVPSNGIVQVRISGYGFATTAITQLLLGVLQSTTVIRRASAAGDYRQIATSFTCHAEVRFLVTGLTSGASLTWDAAYGIETAATNSALFYGGPNDATAGTAAAGISFEIWDVT